MALEVHGILNKLGAKQNGEGRNGPWEKQDFIIETHGEYPKKICFEAWNDKGKEVAAMPIGSPLKVTFSAESREYNERWYTSLRAFGIVNASLTNAPQAQQTKTAPKTQVQAPATEPQHETKDGEEEDDLPF